MRITSEAVSKAARVKRRPDETPEGHLARLTHIALNNKHISNLDGLQSLPLKACSTLYLYDNTIPQIGHLHYIPNLKDLYLQNNNIEEISGLEHSPQLEALHLDNNCISHLSGLTANTQLHELKLAQQRIAEDVVFTFDIPTLETLSWSLGHLDLSMCRLVDPRPLSILRGLYKLDISDNLIEEGETMSDTLPHLQRLSDLAASGNPICRQQKYRQNTIVCCDALEVLDGREVSAKERQYLVHVKRRLAAMAADASAAEEQHMQQHGVSVGMEVNTDSLGITMEPTIAE